MFLVIQNEQGDVSLLCQEEREMSTARIKAQMLWLHGMNLHVWATEACCMVPYLD